MSKNWQTCQRLLKVRLGPRVCYGISIAPGSAGFSLLVEQIWIG